MAQKENSNTQILDYINSTREVLGTPNPSLCRIYHHVFSILEAHLSDGKRPFPHLVITYSRNRSPSFLYLHGRPYLIYDQYLGQTFNMLNRIYCNSQTEDDAEMYTYKLLAEHVYLAGRADIGLLFALSYREMQSRCSTYKTDVDLERRLVMTGLHEAFVLGHELAHWLLSAPGEREKWINGTREFLRGDLFDDDSCSEKNIEANAIQYVADLTRAIRGNRDTDDAPLQTSMLNELDGWQTQVTEMVKQFEEMLETRDDLLEECVCDYLGSLMATGVAEEFYGVDALAVLPIVQLGLEHLVHLSLVGLLGAGTALEKEPLLELAHRHQVDSQFRIHAFRRNWILQILGTNGGDARALHEAFVAVNRRYAEVVRDRVIFVVTQKLEEVSGGLDSVDWKAFVGGKKRGEMEGMVRELLSPLGEGA